MKKVTQKQNILIELVFERNNNESKQGKLTYFSSVVLSVRKVINF
jgi:hypothetical protein